MDIKTPRDLEKILTICRKKGVECIKIGGTEIHLLPEAPKSPYLKRKEQSPDAKPEVTYTDQDVLFWSAAGEVANG